MASKIKSYIKGKLAKFRKSADFAQGPEARFILMHLDSHIGTLELNDGVWSFEYSFIYQQKLKKAEDSSKTENVLLPLFPFPDVEKRYESHILWPFFSARIPGLKQPDVQDIMKSDKIESNDLVALLDRFGRRTIMNPFELRFEVTT